MHAQQPITQTMKISEVKNKLSSLVNTVYRRETRILVEKAGIPVAAIISAEDLKRLERFDDERAQRFRILDEIGEAFKDVPVAELEREVARALHEVRAKRRVEQEAMAGAKT